MLEALGLDITSLIAWGFALFWAVCAFFGIRWSATEKERLRIENEALRGRLAAKNRVEDTHEDVARLDPDGRLDELRRNQERYRSGG